MERRKFIRYIGTVGTAFLVLPQLVACDPTKRTIKTNVIGANKERGHKIRDFQFSDSEKPNQLFVDTVIIGGGITGLSTAYHLKENGYSSFALLEMNNHVGGNSDSGKNKYSAFPLGAHYLTLPNSHNRPLIEFLKKEGLITKENTNGTQEYSEENLCHAPDERLLFRGVFQEGLVPSYGIHHTKNKEISRFFDWMNKLKSKKNKDGKFLFDIPVQNATYDPFLLELDQLTFEQFLKKEGFVSEELNWFLDYCCRDDFGAGFDKVSAWAGINYFAGRKSNPSNTIPSNVLTWPEGNGYLTNCLKKNCTDQIINDFSVVRIEEKEEKIIITGINIKSQKLVEYHAKKAIISCPSYVTKHILTSPYWDKKDFDKYIHHPWMVTTVVLNQIPSASGLDLAWDNVKYGTKGLGYIYNQHQEFNQLKEKYVISVYLAFDKQGAVSERKRMFELTENEMKHLVLEELKSMHPDIEQHIVSMDFQQWGHGMVTPYPGSLETHYRFRENNQRSSRLRLAHTDYSGYSVFEEGFAQGFEAANFIMK